MGKETLRRLQEEALALPEAERAKLALELVRSLNQPGDPDAATAWTLELQRRLAQVENGTAVLVDRDELSKRMQERLGRS
jgi:hypothetical protein